jgi:DNA-binding response OmpR family regulator
VGGVLEDLFGARVSSFHFMPIVLCANASGERANPYKIAVGLNLLAALNQPFYRDEHLFVDLHHQVVTLDSEIVRLTRLQYRVLALLVEHAGEVVPRAIFLTQIWGHLPELSPRQLDPHLNRLRRKLGIYADLYIETVVGIGYRFRPFQSPRYQNPPEP